MLWVILLESSGLLIVCKVKPINKSLQDWSQTGILPCHPKNIHCQTQDLLCISELQPLISSTKPSYCSWKKRITSVVQGPEWSCDFCFLPTGQSDQTLRFYWNVYSLVCGNSVWSLWIPYYSPLEPNSDLLQVWRDQAPR